MVLNLNRKSNNNSSDADNNTTNIIINRVVPYEYDVYLPILVPFTFILCTVHSARAT